MKRGQVCPEDGLPNNTIHGILNDAAGPSGFAQPYLDTKHSHTLLVVDDNNQITGLLENILSDRYDIHEMFNCHPKVYAKLKV
ncbi:MAG: hypothetical protein ACK5RG_13060 [Cyclobacteriaceae bacterium]|nr:hypothetical protein [Flammeovirgaceae bacterium]